MFTFLQLLSIINKTKTLIQTLQTVKALTLRWEITKPNKKTPGSISVVNSAVVVVVLVVVVVVVFPTNTTATTTTTTNCRCVTMML